MKTESEIRTMLSQILDQEHRKHRQAYGPDYEEEGWIQALEWVIGTGEPFKIQQR